MVFTSFFKCVCKKLNVQHRVALLCSNNGTILSNDADKAEALNTYFASIFTPITSRSYPTDIPSPNISVS